MLNNVKELVFVDSSLFSVETEEAIEEAAGAVARMFACVLNDIRFARELALEEDEEAIDE